MITISAKLMIISFICILVCVLILRSLRIKFRIPHFLLIISTILILSGVVLSVSQEKDVQYYNEMKQWPTVMAKVSGTRITGKFAVLPEISYTYMIGDSIYTGTTNLDIPGFGNRKKRDQTARIILQDYVEGTDVEIIYNPHDPSQSHLRRSPPWNVYGRLGFGIFLFAGGSFILLFRLIQKNKSG